MDLARGELPGGISPTIRAGWRSGSVLGLQTTGHGGAVRLCIGALRWEIGRLPGAAPHEGAAAWILKVRLQ